VSADHKIAGQPGNSQDTQVEILSGFCFVFGLVKTDRVNRTMTDTSNCKKTYFLLKA
jgi:hypothetical protein